MIRLIGKIMVYCASECMRGLVGGWPVKLDYRAWLTFELFGRDIPINNISKREEEEEVELMII